MKSSRAAPLALLLALCACATGDGMFVAGSGGPNQDEAYEEPADSAADSSSGQGVLAASGNVLLPGPGGTFAAPKAPGADMAINGAIAPLRSPGAGVAAATPVGSLAVQVQLGGPLTGSGPTTAGAQTPVGQAGVATGGLTGPTTVAASTGGLLGPVSNPVARGPVQTPVTAPPLLSPSGGGLAAPVAGVVAPAAGAVGSVINPSGQPNSGGGLLKK